MLGGGSRQVGAVAPHSPAAQAGLRPRDEIVRIDSTETESYTDIVLALVKDWQRGKNGLSLTVKHADGQEETLPTFYPRTLPLHLTQVYESVSMALLLLLLLACYPLRRRAGSLMVLFMAAYGVHRFLNEMLRIDNEAIALDMTLSQNISLLLLIAAAVLAVVIWRRGPGAAPQSV
jgi:prolipoprotein diacylglyceryltransferase